MIYVEDGFAGNTYDLERPRLLWNSITRRGTVSVSSEADGFDGVNAATATTFDAWKPTALSATWTLTFDEAETVSAVAIASHTIGSTGSSIAVHEWDGSSYAGVMDRAYPTDDSPIAFLFEAREASVLRISILGDTPPQIGVVHMCEALEMPQKVYMGAATPIDLARETEFRTTQSANGQYLGRSIARQKNTNDFTVEHLRESWVRAELDPFIQDALEYPYFLLERPETHPTALSYRWRDQDIVPERMSLKDYMQVSL